MGSRCRLRPAPRSRITLPPRPAPSRELRGQRAPAAGQDLRAADHTPLSRRSRRFAGLRPKAVPRGPLHLVINSTGLKLCGQDEWDEEKHGRTCRSWREVHVAVNVKTNEIGACMLTGIDVEDAGQVPALLGQVDGAIAAPYRRTARTTRCTRPTQATSPIWRSTS
jgi:hypothetical protein